MSVMPPIWRSRAATPEQRLVAAIISQAFTDIFLPDCDDANASLHFLTAGYGPSARWRNQLCSYLDLDGDQLAARVRSILDGDADPPGYDTRFSKHLHTARERWASVQRAQTATATTTRLPRIRPPSLPAPTVAPTIPLEPQDIDLVIADDAFYISGTGHIRASRPWRDGETSRFIGPLPSIQSKIGEALWMITQGHRNGFNALGHIADDPHAMVQTLRAALPRCEVTWAMNGNRLPEYQPNAGLRLYLKQLPKAA